MTDHKTTICQHEHCELVIRLMEWRTETDKKIDGLVKSTGRLMMFGWVMLGAILVSNDGANFLDFLGRLLK